MIHEPNIPSSTYSKNTLILLSGGIDSSATIVSCLESRMNISSLFIDYGQPSRESEWKAARCIADHYDMSIEKIDLGVTLIDNNGEFFGRNALFILVAAGIVTQRPLTITLGVHALSEYYDTTPLFIKHIEQILNGYSRGLVTLNVPFIANTKSEVVQFAKEKSVPIDLTYSCEQRNAPACELCPSCLDRSDFYGR